MLQFSRYSPTVTWWILLPLFCVQALGTTNAEEAAEGSAIEWLSDYEVAVRLAKQSGRMLLVCIEGVDSESSRLESAYPADPWSRWIEAEGENFEEIRQRYLFCKVAENERVNINGKTSEILQHEPLIHMQNSAGVTIFDFTNWGDAMQDRVVSVYPVSTTRKLSPAALKAMVRLPRGTLTQRTLVLALALHPKGPQSIRGDWNPVLAKAAEGHSTHQAELKKQGHQGWPSRFQRLLNQLGQNSKPKEVCAESWPGQSLLEAAEECVASWHQSPGHWKAVSSRQAAYAYDMKQGSNGVWYATGILATP